jgi:mono/diheme cytochrome c family protein
MYLKRLFLTGTLLLCSSVARLHGQESDSPPPTPHPSNRASIANRTREFLGLGPAPDAAAGARGAKLYGPNCAFCHGEKARGAEGPNLVRSPLVLHDERANLIGDVLLHGRPDKGMPAFPNLTQDQRYEIAEFLHMQVELAANRGTYQRLNIVTGDAKKGEAYFNGAGKCSTCHSVNGDLAHIAMKYAPDQLQNRFLWPAGSGGFGRGTSKPKKVQVTLPSGEIISGTVKRVDDFNISMHDSTGKYHSWPRSRVKVVIEDKLVAHRQLLDQYADSDIHNLTAYLVTLK